MGERHYSSYPVWRMRIAQVLLTFVVSLGVLALVVGSAPRWVYPVAVVVFAVEYWWVLWRLPRRRVRESAEGLHTWDIGFPVRRLVRWENIDHFERLPFAARQVLVEAVHPSGRSTSVMGLDAAWVTTWEGDDPGQTDDIVGELNRRLVLWRKELGLGAAPDGRQNGSSPAEPTG